MVTLCCVMEPADWAGLARIYGAAVQRPGRSSEREPCVSLRTLLTAAPPKDPGSHSAHEARLVGIASGNASGDRDPSDHLGPWCCVPARLKSLGTSCVFPCILPWESPMLWGGVPVPLSHIAATALCKTWSISR